MVLQDFTTWNEVDPDNLLTVNSNTLSASQCYSWFWLNLDYGSGYFKDSFSHKFILNQSSYNEEIGFIPYAIYEVNDYSGSAVFMHVEPPNSSDYRLSINSNGSETEEHDISIDLSFSTSYYITLIRDSSSVTVYIRTGSHNGTLIDTITISLSSSINFSLVEFVFLGNYIENLENYVFSLSNFDDGVSAGGTNMQINVGDAWKSAEAMKVNVSDTWKDIASAKVNIGDAWKDIF